MDFKTITTEGEEIIVAFIEGHGLKTANAEHPSFGAIKDLMELDPQEIEANGADTVAALFDPAAAISKRFESLTERISVRNGEIFFDGDPLNNACTNLIVRLMQVDGDFWPFVLFLENLMQNPNEHSRQMAFDWIGRAGDGLSITNNGDVVGFKGCQSDGNGGYQSTHSGHAIVNGEEVTGFIPYAVDDEVTMPRSEVTHDPTSSCSTGLHVGTRSYARTYAYHGALMEVHINPRDIVSVPNGEHDKMRVCRFTITRIVGDDDVYGPLVSTPREGFRVDLYVADTESQPYDQDEYGDGEEFEDALDTDEEIEEDYAVEEDDYAAEDYDDGGVGSTEAFVGRSARHPSPEEFEAMAARAKRRHRGSPGSNAFRTYASTVGGWTLLGDQDGSQPAHWTYGE